MSKQTYDFSSILENAWNAKWNLDSSPEGHLCGDSEFTDMNEPSSSRTFLWNFGLISASTIPDASCRKNEDDTSKNGAVEAFGPCEGSTVDKRAHRSFHTKLQSDESSYIMSRDDQVTVSLKSLSVSECNATEPTPLQTIFPSSLQGKLRLAVIAVQKGNWDTVLQTIHSNPELLNAQSSASRGQTLLHIALSQDKFVPEKVILVMLKVCPRIIYATDSNKWTALHHAASQGLHADLLPILLERWKDGASKGNKDGDSPLHLAALNGRRTELNALILMGAFPQAAGFINCKGMLPLHMACCRKASSHVTIFKLLEIHRMMNLPFDIEDREGLTPFHRAVKSCAPNEILTAFNVYDVKDIRYCPNADLKNGPQLPSEDRTCAESDSMNFQLKTSSIHTQDIIFKSLYEKMPLRLGSVSVDGFSKIIYQGSTKFWWSIATDASGEHFDLVEKILTEFTTFSEIIALTRVTGSDGERNVLDEAHPSVRKMISDNLCLCEVYELHLRLPEKADGLLVFKAAMNDREEHSSKFENSSSTATSNEAFVRGILIHCTRLNSDRDKEVLREIEMRRTLNIVEHVFQRIVNHHVLNGRRFGCPNDEIRLVVFERPYLTLANVLQKHRFRKRRNNGWLRKCRNVLKQLARRLQCLHESGYVHGWLAPEFMAKFGDNEWKLMKMSSIKQVGDIMDGVVRSCIPPESIIECVQPEILNRRSRHISFQDEKGNTTPCNDEVDHLTLEFVPNRCRACTSWDTWGFGLVMGELLLSSSAIYLPNFDRNETIQLKKLFEFKPETIEVIQVSMSKHAGEQAADLIGKLLEPTPHKRLKSMRDVLLHSYFTDEVGHFTV